MKVLLDGKFMDDSVAAVSVWDAGLLNGHGVYESFRSFNGNTKLLDEHFKRLRTSAKALFIPVPNTDDELKAYILKLIKLRQVEEPNYDFRLRLTLTAGNSDIRSGTTSVSTLLITAKKLTAKKPPAIRMQSYNMTRQLPFAKTTAMLAAIRGQHHAAQHDTDEALLVDAEGVVHEGAFCNVYVIKDGVLHYPDTGALQGVTQVLILSLTKGLLPAKPSKMTLQDFYNADEVFTTGSVRGVLEVSQIDGHRIIAPGPYTTNIKALYKSWTEE